MKGNAFVIEIDNGKLSMEPLNSGDKALQDWMTKVSGEACLTPGEPYTRDMILRPTTLSPGVYFINEDKTEATVIVEYKGEAYQQIFCEPGGTDRISAEGDLIFREVSLTKVETTEAPRVLTDAELVALAAFVNAGVAEAQTANADRARKDEAPAYGENWFAPGVVELERELKRRGVLPK